MLKKLIGDQDLFEIFSKSATYMVIRLLGAVLAYVFAYYTVRFYDESTYGFVTLSFTILTISASVFVLGFDINLTRLFAERDGDKKHVAKFYASLIIALLLATTFCGLVYAFSDSIASIIFNKEEFSEYIKWTALTIPFWVMTLLTIAVFRGVKDILKYSIFNSFGRFLLAIIFLFVIVSWSNEFISINEGPIIAHFFAVLVLFLLAIFFLVRRIRFARPVFDRSFFSYFRTSFPILISGTLVMVLTWIDKLFLGILMPEKYVGIYDIAARIALLIGFSLDAINAILTPKIATAFHEGNLKAMQGKINTVSKVNTIISLLVFSGILLFNRSILSFIGEEFLVGQTVLFIICVGQLINSYTGPVWNIMQMTGKQKLLSKLLAVTLVLNVALNYILIKKWGIEGAATTTALCFIFWNIIASYFIYRDLGIVTFFVPKKIKRLLI